MTNSIDMRKRINILTVCLVIVCFILSFSMPLAKADLNETIANMSETILMGTSEMAAEILSDSDGLYNKIVISNPMGIDQFEKFYKAVKVIGRFLVIILAMGHLISNIEKGQDPVECVFKVLIEIGISLIIIMNLDKIISILGQLGTWFITTAGDSVEPKSPHLAASDLLVSLTGDDDGGFGWRLGAIAMLSLPFFLSFAAMIACKFAFYQIILEIGIRKCFAPVAVADIYQEGLRSPGARYLKKFVALFIRLAAAILICNIMGSLSESVDIMGNPHGVLMGVAELLILNFTAVGFIFKTGEIANDVVGA